jgi:hypothetical protein
MEWPRLSTTTSRISGDESILCEVLGKADIAHDPREAGDEPG